MRTSFSALDQVELTFNSHRSAILALTQALDELAVSQTHGHIWLHGVAGIFMLLFGSNWSGALLPLPLIELPKGELGAPTNDINTTSGLTSTRVAWSFRSRVGILHWVCSPCRFTATNQYFGGLF